MSTSNEPIPVCMVCLGETKDHALYHPACLGDLFKTSTLPTLDVDLSSINDLAQRMIGRMSISGVQQKVLVSLTPDRKRIEFAQQGGRYILKPSINTFPEIPANEHVTMQMASLVDIETPPCGLLKLKDGSLAYIITRFDRLNDGTKLQQEDFCQLAELPPSGKYDKSAELCVHLIRDFASEPLISILSLYRLLLFAWCVGNGDLHLKNLSLLTTQDGIRKLSPAYDLVNTKLVIPDDQLALSIGGKKRNLRRKNWIDFAGYCGITERASQRVISTQIAAADEMRKRIHRSFLSAPMKTTYLSILQENIAALAS